MKLPPNIACLWRGQWLPLLMLPLLLLVTAPLAAQEQCNWNNNALFPLCAVEPDNSEYPGWGWENEASCISRDLCSSSQNAGGIVNAASSASSSVSSAAASSLPATALGGWRVSGSQILDPNGQAFVFRGVNHAHTWFTSRLNQSLADIAAAGANAVRVVLSNGTHGTGWQRNNGADVSNVINQCKLNKLVCVLEVHDSTGYGESEGATHISNATAYWLSDDIRAAIDGEEDYVIVNIANEPFGNQTTTTTYVDDTKAAIAALRTGGITHMLMVDGSTWGQDWQGAMRDNAADILAADSYANVVFSVHMYEVYDSASKVQAYMNSFVNKGLALVVGEFGHEHNGSNVAEEAILQYAEELGIGYLGWSWSGNGGCCTSLDIVTNWNPDNFSTWGDILFNSEYGIKATAQLASIFTTAASSSSAASSISSQAPVSTSSASSSSSQVFSSASSIGISSSSASSVSESQSSTSLAASTSSANQSSSSDSYSSSSSSSSSSVTSSAISSTPASSSSISSVVSSAASLPSSVASSASSYVASSSSSLISGGTSSVSSSSNQVSSSSSSAIIVSSASSLATSSIASHSSEASASSTAVSSVAASSTPSSETATSSAAAVSSAAASSANKSGGGGGSMPWQGLLVLGVFWLGRRYSLK